MTYRDQLLIDPLQVEREARRLRAEWMRSLISRRRR